MGQSTATSIRLMKPLVAPISCQARGASDDVPLPAAISNLDPDDSHAWAAAFDSEPPVDYSGLEPDLFLTAIEGRVSIEKRDLRIQCGLDPPCVFAPTSSERSLNLSNLSRRNSFASISHLVLWLSSGLNRIYGMKARRFSPSSCVPRSSACEAFLAELRRQISMSWSFSPSLDSHVSSLS